MAENINFIPATDLPEAIGDEVSVLCLENGELKQKPGASIGGGESLLCRTYTSDDIVINGTSEKYIVDEEVVRAVFQSINNKTQMPRICLLVGKRLYFPNELHCVFGTALDSKAFKFSVNSDEYYIFDTYDNANEYYNR